MSIKDLTRIALEVKQLYAEKNNKQWGVQEYTQGFNGDVGDLNKLIMAKLNYREIEDVDNKIVHELADCLWSILIIADELNIDLELAFSNMNQTLISRLKQND